MLDLRGKIALVTGASRGAGRGIALELGKAGATVYVTGRSVRGQSTKEHLPGTTIDDTAERINELGGVGIAVKCDHTVDEEVAALVERIREEQGRLDLLVNNVWGGNELSIRGHKFEELSLQHWDNMFTSGVRAQVVTNHFAIPLMREQGQGLIVHTTFWDDDKFTGHFYYDLAKNALNRMVYGLSFGLKKDGVGIVAVTPGWMRTEIVLNDFKTDEAHWHEVEALEVTESPHFIGRAVVALTGDPDVLTRTGRVLRTAELAQEYGFTDIDGRVIPPFHVPEPR